jgi:adenosylhomocysteine nucleosidase
MSTVALVCAMPMELRPLTRRLRLRKQRIGDVDVRSGTAAGHQIVAVVTGMGTHLATAATERLLDVVTPTRVVVVGITGAVENETPMGTLVRPEVVIDAATGTERRPTRLGDAVPHGAMWTTDVLTPPDQLAGLRARGVVSLDMETAAIAACCERRAIPWSVVRAISDRASDGSVDEAIFRLSNQDGTPNLGAVARYVVRHPHHLPRMAALGRGAKLATERAAAAAVDALPTLQ